MIDPDLVSTWQKGRTSLRMKFNLDEAAFYLSIVAGVLDGVAPPEERFAPHRMNKFGLPILGSLGRYHLSREWL